jgi:ribulose-5-phosphate 4-epimerase/fuculose-1-phosphate aldolase
MRNIDPQEWEVRCDLAAAYRLLAHFGMDDLIFTHLSARLPARTIASCSTPSVSCSTRSPPRAW